MAVLCIVSVSRPDVVQQARHVFDSIPSVQIIVDRRAGEPRAGWPLPAGERRHRRIDERLRLQGYAIVPTEE
jgi:hypothetical protein